MAEERYNYNMADAIDALLKETTALQINSERISSLRALAEQSREMRAAALAYASSRASTCSSSYSTSSSSSNDSATCVASSTCTESTDSSGEGEGLGSSIVYNNNRRDEAYKRAVEHLVMRLRLWRMELEELKYKAIDFDSPIKRWTRRERNTFRAEIRTMSYELRKKHIIEKMVELNKRRVSKGLTEETKLAVEMIELLLQDIFLLRIMPFKDIVFPLTMDNIYDWEKVSDAIKGTHNAAECQEFWYTKFHPNINGKAWSKAENRALCALADAYNLQHWDAIATQLDTSRSGFQCYVQYRRFLYKDKPVVLKLEQEPEPKPKDQNNTTQNA